MGNFVLESGEISMFILTVWWIFYAQLHPLADVEVACWFLLTIWIAHPIIIIY